MAVVALAQLTMVRTVPGKVTVIMPPQAQLHIAPCATAGVPPIKVVALGGFHGPTGAGTHGIGVKTPRAAAVAEATIGFDRLVHIPNGGMLTSGTMSAIVAAGLPSISTRRIGSTLSGAGEIPNEQSICALATYGSGNIVLSGPGF
jgi:hypothetical protein